MSVQGVDYAFPPWPSPAALAAAGKEFACRYGGPGTIDKWLDPAEAEALSASGRKIVANAEGSASGLLGGAFVGASWAKSADAWFQDCGMPPSKPIYLSVDFNCTLAQWPTVAEALKGAGGIIGTDRIGVYGSYNVVRWARRDGVAKWFWQTYAWSGGLWAAGNHIQQYKNGVTIDGADCDLNEALPADYGQWQPGKLPQTKEIDMLMGKVAGVDTVHIGTGCDSRPLDSYGAGIHVDEAFDVLKTKLGLPIEFSSLAALYAALGQPAADDTSGSGSGLSEAQVRAVVRQELDKTKTLGTLSGPAV